jgi:hypothetical protein
MLSIVFGRDVNNKYIVPFEAAVDNGCSIIDGSSDCGGSVTG